MKWPKLRAIGPSLWGIGVFLLVLGGLAPWIPRFPLTILVNLLIFAALAYSLNFITGLTGYVNFGHVVFMAVGAYTLGYTVGTIRLHPLGGVALGGLMALVLALGLGAVTLRFRGVYFAIASLVTPLAGLNIVLVLPALGGGQGILLNIGFDPLSWFYTIWAIIATEVGLTYWITHGRLGYGIRAIKSDEDAAKSLGVNAPRLKLFLFALSGLFAGATGGVYAWTTSGVFPEAAFDLTFSLRMLAMIVIGGMGTLLGPLIGAIAVYLPSRFFLTIFIGTESIIIGLVVIVIALFVPGGIVGTLRKYVPELRRILE
ncbi:MAG: branched-chain amino acid ABC transporter permease [Methanobacteriota archaeon]|nr:MAG: branched-chain amino acid ABC transporter permease [Euryarchaeota archaeon]